MKKKILFITPFLKQGGVEHSLINALKQIDYSLFDVTLYLYKDEMDLLSDVPNQVKVVVGIDDTHYYQKLYTAVNYTAAVVFGKLHLRKAEASARERIQKYIHKQKIEFPKKNYFQAENFDIVISYSLHIGTEMALEIPAEKYIMFLHNSIPSYHSEIYENCAGKYDKIVAVSDGVKDVYSAAYPQFAGKMTVLGNYVDAEEIKKKASDFDVNPPEHGVRLCTCGRISHEKGFDLAVEAASILDKKGLDFHWLFVGDGAYRPNVDELIKKEKLQERITITGLLNNPYPYIASCDIYVQPSYEEAQPLVLIEAQKLNRPIVSTRTVGGINVLNNGEYGVLTEITAESISAGILRLLEDDALQAKFSAVYTPARNEEEKSEYKKKWQELLSC